MTLIVFAIMIMGQSFTPISNFSYSNCDLKENSNLTIESNGATVIAVPIPEDPKHYRLRMYDQPKTTMSEEFYGTLQEATMIANREIYCEDWHSYVQARKVGTVYQDYDSGDCEPPPLVFIPNENDFAPLDAVALVL